MQKYSSMLSINLGKAGKKKKEKGKTKRHAELVSAPPLIRGY